MDTLIKNNLFNFDKFLNLNQYNNTLLDTFDINKRVSRYDYNASSTSTTAIEPIYSSTTSFKTSNVNNDSIIRTYIYVPEEKVYIFKCNNVNNSIIYINKLKINVNTPITIPKGVFLLTILLKGIQNTTSNVEIQYATWSLSTMFKDMINGTYYNIDNLLLSKDLSIAVQYLYPHFLKTNNDYCLTGNNITNQSCKTIYTSANDNIYETYLSNIIKNNNLYQSPRDGKYGDWDINDTDWNDNSLKESPVSQLKIQNKCLDLPNGATADGTLLQLWDCNNTNSQKFIYNNKTHQIKSAANVNKCIDSGRSDGKLHIWGCDDNNDNQKFKYDAANKMFLKSNNTDLCIDLNANSTNNGTNFGMNNCKYPGNNDHSAQDFTFLDALGTKSACGENRKINRNRIYEVPLYGGNPNKQNPDTTDLKTENLQCYSDTEIQAEWNNLGCNTDISNIPNLNKIRYSGWKRDMTPIKNEITSFSHSNIVSNLSHNNSYINTSYTDKVTGLSNFVMTQDDIDSKEKNVIYSNVIYKRGATWSYGSATRLYFQSDGNLVLKNWGNIVWALNWEVGDIYDRSYSMGITRSGSLKLWDQNWNEVYSSDTDNSGVTHGRIHDNNNDYGSFLFLMNSNTNIVRGYPYLIYQFIKRYFYDNSPNKMMMSYIGYVWAIEDWAFNNFKDKSDCAPWKNSWKHTKSNSFWTGPQDTYGLSKRKALDNIFGYNKEHSSGEYPTKDTNSANYQTVDDRDAFKKSTGFYNASETVKNIPTEVGGSASKICNYLPGYDRQSTDNTNFICMDRTAADDYAWVYFTKKSSKDEFAKDIIKYNTKLMSQCYSGDNKDFVLNWISRVLFAGNDRWSFAYRDSYMKKEIDLINSDRKVSNFSNKKINNFINKLNYSIKENFENNLCNLSNINDDPNCNSGLINIYKNYLNTMNKYCLTDSNKSLSDLCVNYNNKEFITPDNNIIKIDNNNKQKLLNYQSKICEESVNWNNDICIKSNLNKPEIIKQQVNQIDPNTELYKKLTSKYGNELLFQECLNTPLEDKCSNLYNLTKYNSELNTKKNEYCLNPENLSKDKCISNNLINTEQLKQLTALCKGDIKNKECNEMFDKKQDDLEFQKTDIYKAIWLDRNQWWIILLAIVIFITITGLYIKTKKNKKKTNNYNNSSNYNNSPNNSNYN